jgi:hypothetical protein
MEKLLQNVRGRGYLRLGNSSPYEDILGLCRIVWVKINVYNKQGFDSSSNDWHKALDLKGLGVPMTFCVDIHIIVLLSTLSTQINIAPIFYFLEVGRYF